MKIKLRSNDEVDKFKLNNHIADKQKIQVKNKGYSEEQVHWYTIWKQYLLLLFLKKLSRQKMHTFWYSVVKNEVLSISFQIVKQISYSRRSFTSNS